MKFRGLGLALAMLFAACADDAPPRVLRAQVLDNVADELGPYQFEAAVVDDRRLSSVVIRYQVQTSTQPVVFDVATASTATTAGDGGVFTASIGGFIEGSLVSWMVQAQDHRGQIGTLPPVDEPPFVFTVGNVPSQPEVYGVAPDRGPTTGNTSVLIVGRDFRPGMLVRFGSGNRARVVERLSRTQARAITPPGPEGPVTVSVVNPDGGRGELERAFTYLPVPTTISIKPPEGPEAGGTNVDILGTNFGPGTEFFFDGVPCVGTVILNEENARCSTPPHVAGSVDVRVTRPERGESTRANAFTYIAAPIVLSIEPAQGPDGGGTVVTIRGLNFTRTSIVDFDGRIAVFLEFVSSTEIRVVTPAHPEGLSDVTVTNEDFQQGTLRDGFLFVGPPILFAVEPPHAAVEGGAELRVLGDNLLGDSVLTVAGLPPLTCTFVSVQELNCIVPASAAGPVRLEVQNADGRSAALDNAYTYFELTRVIPGEGPSTGGTPVTVQGRFLPANCTISFEGIAARCQQVGDEYECITPGGGPGFVDVDALPSEAGQVATVLQDGFNYIPPPVITAIQPDEGPLRGGTLITISGTGFQAGATVTVGGAVCTNVVVVSANSITCRTPAQPAGVAEVTVNNPDGQSGSFVGFEYIPVTFEPVWGLVDGNTNVTIRGIEFSNDVCVRLAGAGACFPVTRVSDRELHFLTPSRPSTGGVTLTVRSPSENWAEIAEEPFSFRRFVDQTPATGVAGNGETADVKIRDFDGDGDNDLLYVGGGSNMPAPTTLTENRGGTWRTTPVGTGVSAIGNEASTCDVDNDGDLDLTYGVSGGGVRLFINNGSGTFATRSFPGSPTDSYEASFHDVTGDGRCDFINSSTQNADVVARNQNGTFVLLGGALPHEPGFVHDHKIESGDFDGDGDTDLIVVVDDVNFGSLPTQRHRIYLNDGQGRFTEDLRNQALLLTLNGDVFDVEVGDIDGDGDPDIVMPNISRPPYMIINDGNGVFARDRSRFNDRPGSYASSWMGDIEGDGDLDFYLVDFAGGPSPLFLNDGNGQFIRATRGEPQLVPASYSSDYGDVIGDEPGEFVFGVAFGNNRIYTPVE